MNPERLFGLVIIRASFQVLILVLWRWIHMGVNICFVLFCFVFLFLFFLFVNDIAIHLRHIMIIFNIRLLNPLSMAEAGRQIHWMRFIWGFMKLYCMLARPIPWRVNFLDLLSFHFCWGCSTDTEKMMKENAMWLKYKVGF